jgi:Uma2 family endonuclease
MAHAIQDLPHYTYEEYCQWEGRWELIAGIPYAMSPAPVPRHQFIATNLSAEFRGSLKKTSCKHCKASIYLDYKVADDTILQPDVLIVCGDIKGKFLDFPPTLVVEILSPSTAMKDRNSKFYIYQSQKISYYLIIDADINVVEVYKLNTEGKYLLEKTDTQQPYPFQLDADCIIEVELNNIWP